MGKSKAPSIPAAPKYKTDPRYAKSWDELFGLGKRLTNFDFSGGLTPLQDTIEVNPDVVSGYFSSLQPYHRELRNRSVAELAANNQLESSVTANRFGQIETDIADRLQGYTSGLIQQALQNRINLFGTGLNAISGATGYGLQNQGQLNQFNLANYENQVAAALAGQGSQRGGLFGGLTGAGGAGLGMAALAMALPGSQAALIPLAMLGGGALGALGPSGTGGQLMTAGAGLFGAGLYGSKLRGSPGITASDMPFSDLYDTQSLAVKYPYLFGKGLSLN